ncbi:TetR family transcriptional regulator [Brucella intermedia]|uniref:TetR family transcriptional regulator n=1 Tax=Brucella intermedia TaxID=94625 RepID=UPI00224ACFB0|nr:TetR family transcriptional regulator [Brucella intermedia]
MRRTQEQAAQTRMNILSAAERQFVQHGFANTTLEMIASAAGITRGAVYWHFADKYELLSELTQHIALPRFHEIPWHQDMPAHEGVQFIVETTLDWLNLLQENVSQQRLLLIVLHLDGTGHEKSLRYLKTAEEKADRALAVIFETLERSSGLKSGSSANDIVCALKWLIKGVCWSWLHSGQMFCLSKYGVAHLTLLMDSVCLVSRRKP